MRDHARDNGPGASWRRAKRFIGLGVGFVVLLSACQDSILQPGPALVAPVALARATAVASMYAPKFVATAADGYGLNDAGEVMGRSYRDTGCGPFCLPPQDIVVWRNGQRILLPLVPGYASAYNTPSFINNQGLIAGEVGVSGSTTHAALWTPNGASYTAQDLGVLTGASSAIVSGLDDQGRIVGWATQGGAIPTFAAPYMWSQGTGMVNLAALGYPLEIPGGMSPGGKVVTRSGHWYQLGNPASVVTNPPPPPSFFGFGSGIINDNGDQAHFLGTGTQGLIYPFRLSNGVWQQLSSIPTGHLSRAGLGTINLAQDVTFTAGSTGLIAAGPNGVGQSLAALISPAYPGATVGDAGKMNSSGQILSKVMIGRSQRLMKLTPVTPCGANCMVVSSLKVTSQFVEDPAAPGSCVQNGKMYNFSTATITVTSETGAPLANVQVNGRFLDDYWTDSAKTGLTNATGVVSVTHKGLCGVGAIAFLVDGTILGTRSLDRTRGTLTDWVIPSVTPPPNQPPVAAFTYSCNGLACTFDGTGSSDDVAVVGWKWTNASGKVLATTPTFSRTFRSPVTFDLTLTVTDGGGLTNSVTQQVVVTGGSTNQPPVASWTYACTAARVCTFDGTSSSDPDGSIASYEWRYQNGKVAATTATFSRTFKRATSFDMTLTVTDNGGLTATRTQTVVVP